LGVKIDTQRGAKHWHDFAIWASVIWDTNKKIASPLVAVRK